MDYWLTPSHGFITMTKWYITHCLVLNVYLTFKWLTHLGAIGHLHVRIISRFPL